MSLDLREEDDQSQAPEESDQCRFGDSYIFLRAKIQSGPRFTAQAYLPDYGGIQTVTNENTSNGTLRIVKENSMIEPEESDFIYFSRNTINLLGLQMKNLKDLKEKEFEPDKSGTYSRISEEVLRRVEQENPPTARNAQKRTG